MLLGNPNWNSPSKDEWIYNLDTLNIQNMGFTMKPNKSYKDNSRYANDIGSPLPIMSPKGSMDKNSRLNL